MTWWFGLGARRGGCPGPTALLVVVHALLPPAPQRLLYGGAAVLAMLAGSADC